jgi:hypothetical protein
MEEDMFLKFLLMVKAHCRDFRINGMKGLSFVTRGDIVQKGVKY